MNWMILLSLPVIFLIWTEIVVSILVLRKEKPLPFLKKKRGKVSILITARNEENNIGPCLESLKMQDYDDFEILVADDDSEDKTYEIIQSTLSDKMQCFRYRPGLAKVNPKAMALAFLATKAKGEYLAIADADVLYPSTWLCGLLDGLGDGGIVSGITGVEGSMWQDMEWKTSIRRMALANRLGMLTSAIGNNMLVRRSAFDRAGGFESVKLSPTEDQALCDNVKKEGYRAEVLYNNKVLAYTKPIPLTLFFHQRVRWMNGVMKQPLFVRSLLTLQALVLPVLLLLGGWHLLYASLIFVSWLLVKSLTDGILQWQIDRKVRPVYILLYNLCLPVFHLILLVLYLMTGTLEWKGRKLPAKK
ncbi:MAG: glycosyltransferase [Cyclobacteriaceae bacterium]|nr:glycosyltransferase [Cyclobacteriaceae bacterium]